MGDVLRINPTACVVELAALENVGARKTYVEIDERRMTGLIGGAISVEQTDIGVATIYHLKGSHGAAGCCIHTIEGRVFLRLL